MAQRYGHEVTPEEGHFIDRVMIDIARKKMPPNAEAALEHVPAHYRSTFKLLIVSTPPASMPYILTQFANNPPVEGWPTAAEQVLHGFSRQLILSLRRRAP